MEEYPKYRQTHSVGIIDSSKFFSDPIFDFRGGSPSTSVQVDPRAMQRDETSTLDLTTNPWGHSGSHHDDGDDDDDDDYTFDSIADAALPMQNDSFAANVTESSVEDGSYARPVRSHRRRLLGLLYSGNQDPVSIQSEPLDKTLDGLVLSWTNLTVDEIQR
jgi:hypothetical protein